MSKLFDLFIAVVSSFAVLVLLGVVLKIFWLAFAIGWEVL
jgi:hypothetical protein